MRVEGAVALVAGGASGLGAATARSLAEAGAEVVVLDLDSALGVAEPPPGAVLVAGDVLDEASVRRAVEARGPLRIAVVCAGVATPGRVLLREGSSSSAEFERVLRINTVGTFTVVRLAAEAMAATEPVAGERGVVVTTSSVAAFDGQIGQAAYAASKGAVAAMTLPLAREFAAHLIRVVSIAPGVFDTPLLAGLGDDVRAALGAQVPHPARLGHPDEFAALVRHVAENPMLNGTTLRLDGALRLPPR